MIDLGGSMLGKLVREPAAKRAEYSKRNRSYDEETFEAALQATREIQGWTLQRENKSTVRMRRPKRFDEILENRFWNVLYRFGYDDLNEGRSFKITVGKGPDGTEKQIDVLAKDAETVVVAECKSCETPQRRSLLKDLNEFAGLQKPISEALRTHYGDNFKPKVIWCFVTHNVRWSTEDLKRANDHNIKVIRELELLYFEEFSKKIGPAARYQFHAEYLANQKVPALSGRKVPAVKTKLGKTTAYLFSALAKDVLRIAFVNHRDLRDPSGAPSYQRIVKPARLKQIGAFLDERGFFPNTVLLNFHKQPGFELIARDDLSGVQFGNLILPDRYKSCWVIDGQHRLYGTAFTANEYKSPMFFVAFDKITPAEEANIFVEINAKQATVPATLLSALDGEVKWDSPNLKDRLAAIASRTVDLLNTGGGGPLEGKVVSPGITAATSQPLNLRSLQERITLSGLLGTISGKEEVFIPGPCWAKTQQDAMLRLVSLLDMHLEHVREANPQRWEAGRFGSLCTNLGVGSQIRLLDELIKYASFRDHFEASSMEIDELYKVIEPMTQPILKYIKEASDEEVKRRFTVVLGSTGYHEYFYNLFSLIADDLPGLKPEGFEEYKRMSSQELAEQADRHVKWVQAVVPAFMKERLRERVGENWFEQTVGKEVQKSCQARRIDDEADEKLPVEEYLDWIQFANLAKVKEIREDVKETLSIRLPDEQSGKHFYAGWFDAINRIRRIAAHPSGRAYKQNDIETLSIVVDHLESHLPKTYSESGPDASVS